MVDGHIVTSRCPDDVAAFTEALIGLGVSPFAVLLVVGGFFVFQREFGLDEQQFGILFGVGAVWLIAATQLNVRLLDHTGPAQSSFIGC